MTYLINRTSVWPEEDPEVEGAYPIQVHEIYMSKAEVCPSFILINCINIRQEEDLWIGECTTAKDFWAIDINSLEELNALISKVGYAIIIHKAENTEGLLSIEIYDSYRE